MMHTDGLAGDEQFLGSESLPFDVRTAGLPADEYQARLEEKRELSAAARNSRGVDEVSVVLSRNKRAEIRREQIQARRLRAIARHKSDRKDSKALARIINDGLAEFLEGDAAVVMN
jgi:hypothetical protein